MAEEGINFTLPALVLDHVANTDRNLSYIKCVVRKYAKVGVTEGDGLKLFKIRTVRVPTEEEGRPIIRTENMIILQC